MGRYNIIKTTSRLMALLLCLMMLLSVSPTAHADGESGSCGSGLSWSLSGGILTISGSGEMTDFPESTMAPWYPYREEIEQLVLPAGLTHVGDLAFYGCEKLTSVVIPDSVTSIGSYSFALCTGMEMLNLGSGVTAIGESAFSDCGSLTSLRLPGTLRTIGKKAFYRCETITSVTVPSSVRSLGNMTFGYCVNLVSANIQANISTIPEFLFYGCEMLSTVTLPDQTSSISEFAFHGCGILSAVHYGGSIRSPEEIQQIIDKDVPGFGSAGLVTDEEADDTITAATGKENDDGSLAVEQVIVAEKENTSVSTKVDTVRNKDGSSNITNVEITVTVEDTDGWQEAQDTVEKALQSYEGGIPEDKKIEITVYVKNVEEIGSAFIESLAGKNVNINIVTQDGSKWRLDGATMGVEGVSGNYDLSYSLTAGTAELNAELETQMSYILRFRTSAAVNAEVYIRLGTSWALQNATLFQRDEELKNVQSVVVDSAGFAHFYLASVNQETEYYIAMNLPVEDEAIVPDELMEAYGAPVRHNPIEYEITGRTSSWNMNINQVTYIMVGVLLTVVVTVGVVMFALNKRKLKRGYVPDIDEEDYNT